jgi:hypothetical protein
MLSSLGAAEMIFGFPFSRKNSRRSDTEAMQSQCEALGKAIGGTIGDTVREMQLLIREYYDNVRDQADESFKSAKRVAVFGFIVLIFTIAYVIVMDYQVSHGYASPTKGMRVGTIGLVGSGMFEFIAWVQFGLYGRATKQFGAFHICLERTHRYLMAYQMTQEMTDNKDATLEKIVCIMANAAMITREDIEGAASGTTLLARHSARAIPSVSSPQE